MGVRTHKKYIKREIPRDYGLWKLFAISFFGMLLLFTFLINSFSPSVDVSIGDYKQETERDNTEEIKKIVDGRLALIQEEDQGKNFTELMKNPQDIDKESIKHQKTVSISETHNIIEVETVKPIESDSVYKVYIGVYTSAEQAKVAKDIIVETGISLNPIVKCLGSNNYTLQVGTFKNKNSADSLLYTIQKNHLPGRVVQEY